ncbi:hypothetical protein [Haloarcula argentinensis]|uniref:Uncharacterized protein n=1 Tax=Haloarcula argentinensis TaxID=43776 RepID=A0ABU2F160_HALAR|nr:hypothetical protein [Haloarcula argentinensis]MDS0254259.1 hypothetical protein [Haloarcula argentinensis]
MSAGVLVVAGCSSNDDDSTNDEQATTTPTPTETPTPERETLVDETLYYRERYPFDLQAGQRLVITVDVERGGPVVVDVADAEAGESLFSDRVETQETFEVDLQSTGTHYVTFQNVSEASIEIVLVEATD